LLLLLLLAVVVVLRKAVCVLLGGAWWWCCKQCLCVLGAPQMGQRGAPHAEFPSSAMVDVFMTFHPPLHGLHEKRSLWIRPRRIPRISNVLHSGHCSTNNVICRLGKSRQPRIVADDDKLVPLGLSRENARVVTH
jgi:hypothetical protein